MYVKTTWFDVSRAMAPMEPVRVTLHTLYTVKADSSYDVVASGDPERLVALRTTSGEGVVWIAGSPATVVGSGTLILFHYADLQRFKCKDAQWDFWWMEFTAASPLPLPFDLLTNIPIVRGEMEYLRRCLLLLRGSDPEAQALASATLGLLLHEWASAVSPGYASDRQHRESVDAVIQAMHDKLAEEFSVPRMAAIACLGPRRFRQVFQEYTGKTPKRFFDQLRLDYAADLLRLNGLSVAKTSEMLGYSSPFHFSRTFQMHFGMPPSRYRAHGARGGGGAVAPASPGSPVMPGPSKPQPNT